MRQGHSTPGGQQQILAARNANSRGSLFWCRSVSAVGLSDRRIGTKSDRKRDRLFSGTRSALGAASVIATLWNADEIGASRLMIKFYALRKLHPDLSKAECFVRPIEFTEETGNGSRYEFRFILIIGRPSFCTAAQVDIHSDRLWSFATATHRHSIHF